MGLSISKQLIEIKGKPVIWHTLTAFEKCDVINEVVVVCRECDMTQIKAVTRDFSKVKAVTVGGDTRMLSVRCGVDLASGDARFVAIHDGARMLITDDEIKKVVSAAYECGGATLGTPVTDTIKVVSDDSVILSTPKRSTLRAVQTPQVFDIDLYNKAFENAVKSSVEFTDDCSMVEALGYSVRVVDSGSENIKLTTQTDILLAGAILDKRNGG